MVIILKLVLQIFQTHLIHGNIITDINNNIIDSYGFSDGVPIEAHQVQLSTINGINTVYNAQFSVTTENGCTDDENIEITVDPPQNHSIHGIQFIQMKAHIMGLTNFLVLQCLLVV